MENKKARREALDMLKSKDKFADGGVKKPLTPDELKAIIEKFKDVTPSERTSFSPEEVKARLDKLAEIRARDPRLGLVANDIAQRKLSKNPIRQANSNLDVNLPDFTAAVRGSNPPLEVPQVVKGSGGFIEDISRVKGKIPVDDSVQVIRGNKAPAQMSGVVEGVTENIKKPAMMTSVTEDEFRKKLGDYAEKKATRLAGLNALKLGSKKAMAAIPIVGGIGAALASGDASAAMPMGFDSEELGPGADTIEGRLERGERLSPEEQDKLEQRRQALEALKMR